MGNREWSMVSGEYSQLTTHHSQMQHLLLASCFELLNERFN